MNRESLEVAGLLNQTYMEYVGRKKGELNEALTGLEDLGHDYRYVRGLATLLDRRCRLNLKATTEPVKARRKVFALVHEKGFPTDPEKRKTILSQAALELDVTVEELEESLYADLEDEFTLEGFEPVDPEALLKQYNLSLTQTLLFYSKELTFTTTGNWQRIFRQIKWLGLIYTISRNNGSVQVRVDGPSSLFKLSRRYGTSLAKLLPTVIQNRDWTLKAMILRRKGDRQLLNFELDSRRDDGLMESLDKTIEMEAYDSRVEGDFASRFKALETGWELTREPEPLPVGTHVMIPDFGFQKGSLQVYLEVVGFWTPQYLKDKIEKLGHLGSVDMIVAVDADLACQKLDQIGRRLNVLYYNRKIPLKPVLAHLKDKEEQLAEEQARCLDLERLTVQEPVVEAEDLAKTLGILEEVAKRVLKEKSFPGYKRLGDMLIKEAKLQEIEERLRTRMEQGELNLKEASRIIEDAGGKRPTNILDALGYKIDWHGIDSETAKVLRKSNTQQQTSG
jgi:hypothetical protein